MAKTIKKTFDVADNASKVDTLRSLIIDAVTAQRKVDKAQDPVSNKLLKLAKGYQDKDTIGKMDKLGYNEAAADKFIDACKEQESFIRSKEAKSKQVDKLPRCWTLAKSNIKAAMIHGLDLSKYESESALRKAVQKARAARSKPDAVKEACKAMQEALQTMPEDKALAILASMDDAIKEALAAIVPVEPSKTLAVVESKITQH